MGGQNEREREKNEDRERERERHWKGKWEQSAGECVRVCMHSCVCVCVCIYVYACVCVCVCCRQLSGMANACWSWAELSWKPAQSPSPSQPGWHDASSAAGIARCLSHKGTIKERWYLAAPLSSGFPQLTVASVGGSPLLFSPPLMVSLPLSPSPTSVLPLSHIHHCR